ncbi:MAG: aminoacyl-tRNA hydrolase [bacterium]
MKWIFVGLGNPGDEYVGTRHNVGRDFLLALEKKILETDKSTKIILPDVFMNDSGKPVKKLWGEKPSVKALAELVVVHDDLDLPLGKVKISFGSGAGGHRGVASIQKALKTKDFVRVRVGISPATPGGKLKKPDQEKVIDFVLGTFKPSEQEKLKKAHKLVGEALELLVVDGREKATMEIHSR